MSEIFANKLTIKGQQKKAEAEANNTPLNITTFKVGDGNGTYYEPNENQTALVNVKYTGTFTVGTQSQIVVNPSASNEVLYKCFIPADVGGFTIRELGLFDDDGDLILICKLPAQDKFALASGIYQPLTFTPKIIYTNPQTQAVLTPVSQTLPTKSEVANMIETGVLEGIENIEFIEPLKKAGSSVSIELDDTLKLEEGKLSVSKRNVPTVFAINRGNIDINGNPDILYAPGSGTVTDNISSPRMTTTPLDGYSTAGTKDYFNMATGNIYSGQTGTLYFPEKITVTGFTSAAYTGNSYYVARGATVSFYDDSTLVGQKTYDPLTSQGKTTVLDAPLPNINKVVHSYGWGSSWGGDGGGQACPGISINGIVVRSVSTARRAYFKVGGEFSNLKITDALGCAAILSNINSIEIPQISKSKFNIFVKKDGSRECFSQAQFGKDLKVSFNQENANDDYGLHAVSVIGAPSFTDKKFTSNGITGLEYNILTLENGPWCIQGKFKFNTTSTRYYCFASGGYNVHLTRETSNKLAIYLSSNGTSWNLASVVLGAKSNWDITTEYYIRVRFTGTQYLVDWSTDYNLELGTGLWTNDITINSTSVLYQSMSDLFFGISNDKITNPFAGVMKNLQVSVGSPICNVKNKFAIGKRISTPFQNDIFYNVSGEAELLKYDGLQWNPYDGVYVGSLSTDINGYIDAVFQSEFNQNGYDVNKQTVGALTKCWISSEYTPVLGTETIVTHNLNLANPLYAKAEVLLKCVIAEAGYSVGDYIGQFASDPNGVDLSYQTIPVLRANTASLRTANQEIDVISTAGSYQTLTINNWRYVFKIWY